VAQCGRRPSLAIGAPESGRTEREDTVDVRFGLGDPAFVALRAAGLVDPVGYDISVPSSNNTTSLTETWWMVTRLPTPPPMMIPPPY
jgi:hypothetical protein